jgi:hypothetical protein
MSRGTIHDGVGSRTEQREQIHRWLEDEYQTVDNQSFLQLRADLVSRLEANHPELSRDQLANIVTQWFLDRSSISQLQDQARSLRQEARGKRNLANHYASLFERLAKIRTAE